MTADLIVIGSGPGGYVAALRAARLGLSVTVVEREALGGVCLNTGCIPSKALLDSTEAYWEVRAGNVHGVVADGLRLDWGALQKRCAQVVGRLSGGVGHLLKKAGVTVVRGQATVPRP
ncbi:FAD-dependent oxidoreductase, partial [bacterium]|nr:FAD-dependent oxidoreductase [bacterium]